MDAEQLRTSIKLPNREILSLSVTNCGYEKCHPLHSWGPAVRDHYLIHYITDGMGYYKVNSKTYTLKAGEGFIAFPGDIIYYYADRDNPWSYCWVGFNGTDAERLVNKSGLSEQNLIFHFDKERHLESDLFEICRHTGLSSHDEIRRQSYLLLFLATLMEYNGIAEENKTSGYDYLEKATRFIESNYFYDISVESIASHVGISRSHLYRLFSEHFHCSPSSYLIKFRINRACVLLKSEKLTVGEAAYSTGFVDQLYFSRVFKKYMGCPPSVFQTKNNT